MTDASERSPSSSSGPQHSALSAGAASDSSTTPAWRLENLRVRPCHRVEPHPAHEDTVLNGRIQHVLIPGYVVRCEGLTAWRKHKYESGVGHDTWPGDVVYGCCPLAFGDDVHTVFS